MRRPICQLVACAVLLMGIEGAVDVAGAHSDAAHLEHTPATLGGGDGGSGPEPDPGHGHCGHYCHGHLATLPAPVVVPGSSLSDALAAVTTELHPSHGPAPPTPPPNA